jgi:hypothetical protein
MFLPKWRLNKGTSFWTSMLGKTRSCRSALPPHIYSCHRCPLEEQREASAFTYIMLLNFFSRFRAKAMSMASRTFESITSHFSTPKLTLEVCMTRHTQLIPNSTEILSSCRSIELRSRNATTPPFSATPLSDDNTTELSTEQQRNNATRHYYN